MVDKNLIDYIKKELKRGVSEDRIRLNLFKKKWAETEIESSLKIVKTELEKEKKKETPKKETKKPEKLIKERIEGEIKKEKRIKETVKPKESNFNYRLAFTFLIIILFLGSGGYYAYNKIQALTLEKQQLEKSKTEAQAQAQRDAQAREQAELKTELQRQERELERQQIEKEREISEVLHIGNTLQAVYSNMRSGYDFSTKNWFTSPLGQRHKVVGFASFLASHDSGQTPITIPKEYGEIYHSKKGSYPWTDAKNKLEKVIELAGVNRYGDSDREKITKILSFINQHIEYQYDINNELRAPVETLGLRSGDCDDFSILTSALFELVNIPSAIELVKNDRGNAHAMVLIHSNEQLPIYQYPDLSAPNYLTNYIIPDGFGVGLLSEKSWYIIEPQWTFEKQKDPSIKEWKIVMISEVEPFLY